MRYYGLVTVSYNGWFEADGIEEIADDPERYAVLVEVESQVEYMDEDEDTDGNED